MAVTATEVLDIMRGWLGMSRNAQTHRPIIDIYNSYRPLARGYAVTYWDDYCDTTVSAVFIKLNAVDMIGGTECGVHEHIQIFKRKGIWKGRTEKPSAGWIITYDWDADGIADHIGFVESISGDTVTAIEGNTSGGIVGRRTITWNNGCVYGYASPAYAKEATPTPETKETKYMFEFSKIRYGDTKSKDVKIMQAALRGRGYINRKTKKAITVDGSWGDDTQEAWKYFCEKNNGGKVTKYVSKALWKKLLWRS